MDYLKLGSVALAVLAFSVVGFKAVEVVKDMRSYISTNGLSDRIVDSDEVGLIVSIRNDADVLKDISEKRAKEKATVINFLKQNGIQDSEIDRVYCDIEENYRYYKEDEKKKYKVMDKISIQSPRVEDIKNLAGDLSKLIDEGICVCFDITFYYKDMDKLRIEMLEEATKDSMNRAERIAKISGNRIQSVRNVSTGAFSITSAESSYTSTDEWSAERALKKRVRVVVHGIYNTN